MTPAVAQASLDTRAVRLGSEAGIAMQMVIVIMVIMVALLTTVTTASINTAQSSNARSGRVAGLGAGDSAILKYQQALNSGLTNENSGFFIDSSDMTALATAGVEWVVPSSSTPYSDVAPAVTGAPAIPLSARYTMKEQIRGGAEPLYGYWQIYRVFPPNYAAGNGKLVVYIRAWQSTTQSTNKADTTSPRMMRAVLRQGVFADYQLLSDGPLAFQANSTINGRVHSNGFLDDFLRPPAAYPDARVWREGAASCTSNALISTARGTIQLPPGCKTQPATGEYVNLLRAQQSFDTIAADCPAVTACFNDVVGPGQRYRVSLTTTSTTVTRPGGSTTTFTGAARPPALLFNGDVAVSGVTKSRLTIAARNPNPTGAAANIIIIGNTGRNPTIDSTLGLVAQGNVVVDMAPGSCPVSNITAALVAASGGLTIPVGYTTQMYQKANTPKCGTTLTIKGSVTSHRTPTLHWKWGASGTTPYWAGYSLRRYEWDVNLRTNPPPYFPVTDGWEVMAWKSANSDCYDSPDPACV